MSHKQKVWVLTFLYAVVVIVLSSFHEVWRDEVVCMSIAADSHSWADLFKAVRQFGHPGLWHALLYSGYQIFPHFVLLKVINLVICIAAIYLFLNKSPFGWVQKVLFIAGFFPLYLYPVINRNYGIGMLIAFIICIFYKERWKRFVPLSCALFLFAQVHAHCFILTLAVLSALFVEFLLSWGKGISSYVKKSDLIIGLTIIFAGLFLSALQVLPEKDSVVFTGDGITLRAGVVALIKSIINPGVYFQSVLGIKSTVFVNAVVFVLCLSFLRKLNILAFLAAGVIGLSMFFNLVYYTQEIRHQASLYLLIVMALWASYDAPDSRRFEFKPLSKIMDFLAQKRNVLFTLLLVFQVFMSVPAIKDEILKPYSSSWGLGEYIAKNPQLQDAIILGEPESNLESLPYYLGNPLYIYSDQRFARYRDFKSTGLMKVSLGDVLKKAEEFKAEFQKPVLIIVGDVLKPAENAETNTFQMTHDSKSLTYSNTDLDELNEKAVRLAHFGGAVTDENYSLYLMK